MIPILAVAVLVGAWCVRLGFAYGMLLQTLFMYDETSPADAMPRGNKTSTASTPSCVVNAFDCMRYSDAGPDGNHGDLVSLLFRAVRTAVHGTDTVGASSCPRIWLWTGGVLYGCLVLAFYGAYAIGFDFFALCVATGTLLVLAIVDAETTLLPDVLTLSLLWLGLVVAWVGGPVLLHDAVAGVVFGYLFLWLLSCGFRVIRHRNGMGHGDFKLFAALGAWVGIGPLPYVLLFACMSGILFACIRQKRVLPSGAYPFGPFLAAGGMGAMLAQSPIPILG